MRRFFSTAFILLALVVGTVSVAPVAHAAVCTAGWVTDNNDETFQADGVTPCTQGASSGTAAITNTSATLSCPVGQTQDLQTGNCVSVSASGVVTQQAPPTDTAAQNAAAQIPTDLKQTTDEAYNGIMQKILTLFAWLVGVAAITLDNAVYYTVVNMGTYVHNLSAVGVTWRILRDLGNIMLIFGFLAVGITTIINVDWYGGGKKMLPMMFVAAIFLNFSLFISEAIIDTGNLFATQFYTQINGGTLAGAKDFTRTSINNDGISNKLMGQLGFQRLYGDTLSNVELLKGNSPWLIGFMGIILFLVTAFVMFSLAFVLITRFIVLIFLIILAPIGFAGLAVPQLAGRAKQWWDTLFQQTITAPVLLLLLYVALAVITDAQFLMGSSTDWTGIFIGKDFTGFGSMLLSFLVAMGLLLLVVVQSKSLSAVGAAGASKLAGKLSFGVTGWAANKTIGRGAYHLGRVARQSKGFNTFDAVTGRVSSRLMDRAASGSFDIRGSKAFGSLKNVGLGIDAGKVAEGGFGGARKRNIEDHEKAIKAIDTAIEDRNLIKSATAAKARAAAESEYEKTGKPLEAQVKTQEDEVKRLNAIVEENRKKNILDKSSIDALKAAQDVLKKSQDGFDAEKKKLKVVIDAEKAVAGEISSAKKEAKVAYAEGINHPINNVVNPLNLIAYGPRTNEAAAKIVKATLKKETDLEKFAKEVAKINKNEEKETQKPEEKRPEENKLKPSDE